MKETLKDLGEVFALVVVIFFAIKGLIMTLAMIFPEHVR